MTRESLPRMQEPELRTDDDPKILHQELLGIISTAILADPRSLQTRIGPSEIGTPCTRKLILKLGEVPSSRPSLVAWRTRVGTAVHEYLTDIYVNENKRLGWTRFLVKTRISPGMIGDVPLRGEGDLFDRLTGAVIDWKVPGPTGLKKMRKDGPDQTYRIQGQLYGRGYELRGFTVTRIIIMAFPANGEFSDTVVMEEPYDRDLVTAVMERVNVLHKQGTILGFPQLAALAPTADDHCLYCSYWDPAKPDVHEGRCPGDPGMDLRRFAPPSGNPLETGRNRKR